MRKNNTIKYKALLDTGRLLFCLLAFCLLSSLLPTALSLEMRPRVIGSSGSITYSANSTLMRARNFLGYISGENHDVGDYWDDFDTDLPEVYESGVLKDGGYYCYFYPGGGQISVRAGFQDHYGFSPPNMGDKVMRWEWYGTNRFFYSVEAGYPNDKSYPHPNHPLREDMYQSWWVYFPSEWINDLGWTYFWQRKEFTRDGSLGTYQNRETEIRPAIIDGRLCWNIAVVRPDGEPEAQEPAVIKYFVFNDYARVDIEDGVVLCPDDAVITYPSNGFDVPVERWFRLETWSHLALDKTGEFKIWITDPNNPNPSRRDCTLLFSAENCITRKRSGESGSMMSNMHHIIRSTAGYYYTDEIYIYNYNAHEG